METHRGMVLFDYDQLHLEYAQKMPIWRDLTLPFAKTEISRKFKNSLISSIPLGSTFYFIYFSRRYKTTTNMYNNYWLATIGGVFLGTNLLEIGRLYFFSPKCDINSYLYNGKDQNLYTRAKDIREQLRFQKKK